MPPLRTVTLYRAHRDGTACGAWAADFNSAHHSATLGQPDPDLRVVRVTITPATPAVVVAALGWEPGPASLDRAAELLAVGLDGEE